MQPLSIVHASSPALEAHATTHYITGGGVHIERHTLPLTLTEARAALSSIARALDTRPGVLLGSSFEYPGRYSRYDIGLVNPPLRITCSSERVELVALNARGTALLPMLLPVVSGTSALMDLHVADDVIRARVRPALAPDNEEERSRSASVFDLLRALVAHLGHAGDTARSATASGSASSPCARSCRSRSGRATWCCTCPTSWCSWMPRRAAPSA